MERCLESRKRSSVLSLFSLSLLRDIHLSSSDKQSCILAMLLANSRSLFLVKKRCIIEYHQRRNQIASYDDAERRPVALYKVGIVWVQGQSLEAHHSCVREVAIFALD